MNPDHDRDPDRPPAPDEGHGHASDDADLEDWLAALAGRRTAHGADARTTSAHEEAARLRAALLAQPAPLPAGEPQDDGARADRLLQRAVAAGLVSAADAQAARTAAQTTPQTQPTPPTPAQPRPRTNRRRPRLAWAAPRWSGYALAALAAGLVALPLWWSLRDAGDPATAGDAQQTLRGASEQAVVAADPTAQRDAFIARLRAAGVDAAPFERLGRLGADVAWPQPASPAALEALRASDVRPPAGPQLVVWFDAPAARTP